jgi:hypothetical protein
VGFLGATGILLQITLLPQRARSIEMVMWLGAHGQRISLAKTIRHYPVHITTRALDYCAAIV